MVLTDVACGVAHDLSVDAYAPVGDHSLRGTSRGDARMGQRALHPDTGDWTYFLTVNPTTGETLFTNSFTQFQQFQAELAKNTGK